MIDASSFVFFVTLHCTVPDQSAMCYEALIIVWNESCLKKKPVGKLDMDWQNCITLAPERKKCLGYIKSIYDDLRLKFFEDTNNTIVLMIIFFRF